MSINRTTFNICSDGYGEISENDFCDDLFFQSYVNMNDDDKAYKVKTKTTWRKVIQELNKLIDYKNATFAKVRVNKFTPSSYSIAETLYIFNLEKCPKELLKEKYTFVE